MAVGAGPKAELLKGGRALQPPPGFLQSIPWPGRSPAHLNQDLQRGLDLRICKNSLDVQPSLRTNNPREFPTFLSSTGKVRLP